MPLTRPPYIASEYWVQLTEAERQALVGVMPSPSDLLVDPELRRASERSRNNDGRREDLDSRAVGGKSLEVSNRGRGGRSGHGNRGRGNARQDGSSNRKRPSRSNSPNVRLPRRRLQSPSPASSPPPTSSPASVLLDISRNQQEILRQNRDLRDRLAVIEDQQMHAGEERAENLSRNAVNLANRGRSKRAKRVAVKRHVIRGKPDSENEDDADDEIARDDSEDLRLKKKELSRRGQEARKILQDKVGRRFRKLCGVSIKASWPTDFESIRSNEATGEVYFTPDFSEDVGYEHNVTIFEAVALSLWEELRNDKALPEVLTNKNLFWNKDTLHELAKQAFRNFKPQYMKQVNEEKAATMAKNQRNNRWASRRSEKATRLLRAVPAYMEKNGADPTPFIGADHMSDEASSPDDDSGETFDEWKVRMAAAHGIRDSNEASVSRLKFLEKIQPKWRSAKLTKVFKELRDIEWSARTVKQKQKVIGITVEGTGRSTSAPPLVAPYDFGIDMTWWETEASEYPAHVVDWLTHGNPDGFGVESDTGEEGEDGTD